MTVKLPAAERQGKFTGHDRSYKGLEAWQDVRSIKFTAADIGLMIAGRVLISVVACIMTAATSRMGRFRSQQFQGVGMNSGRHNQNYHQHHDGDILYGLTKYSHDYMNIIHFVAIL